MGRAPRRRGLAIQALLLILPLWAGLRVPQAMAQGMATPVEVQVPLMLKILNFDRSLRVDVQRTLVVGVLYQAGYRTSAQIAEQVRHTLLEQREQGVGTWALRVVPINLDETGDLDTVLVQQRVTVLYVSPLRAVSLRKISGAARAKQITTLTGVPDYVEDGLAIGIDLQDERPQIIMNLAASRAEGADFTAQLLQLARLVDQPAKPGSDVH
ncbi:MAG TPA: YfiR/HmsC family protein [Gemmatimonadales bacterium]